MAQIFEHSDYKTLVKAVVEDRKRSFGRGFSYQSLAKACRVQKTYVSRVLNGDGHFNEDQIFLAATFLGLKGQELEYLVLLHRYDRSVVQERRKLLRQDLETIRKENLKSKTHLTTSPIEPDAASFVEYYLDPDYQVLHQLLSISRFQTDQEALQKRMNIDAAALGQRLAKLEDLGLIKAISEEKQRGFCNARPMLHLSAESPLFRHQRSAMKLAALHRLNRASKDGESYSINVLFTADSKTRKSVQEHFMKFLQQVEALVREAPSEELYYLSFDLAEWFE